VFGSRLVGSFAGTHWAAGALGKGAFAGCRVVGSHATASTTYSLCVDVLGASGGVDAVVTAGYGGGGAAAVQHADFL
jgi:hypothetical protein